MVFRYEHKELSWLFGGLAVLAFLFIALLQWKKGIKRQIGDTRLVETLIRNYSSRRFFIKFLLVFIAFGAGVLAIMNPRRPGASSSGVRNGIDVAIVLDVSKSMLAADLAPNRLERAKQFITKLLQEIPNDQVALVLFAGKAYMQMPLTADHGAAQLYISSASPDALPQQGTVISDALQMSEKVFNNSEDRFKSVILITDGEDHDNAALQTASTLSEKGVMINTVGIGSPDGSVITDPATGGNKTDEAGNTVISKLNEELLKEIADRTNGVYIRLQSSDGAVAKMKSQLSQIDKKAYADISQMNFRNYYGWLAAVVLLLLLAENFITEKLPAGKTGKKLVTT